MATSEAQKRAVMKYQQKMLDQGQYHKFTVGIYDSKDPDLWEWLTSREEGKGETVRRLMRQEIERTGWKRQ